jgi:hypothetical protein
MPNVIDSVPTSFDVPPFAGRWFRWSEVADYFCQGHGGSAALANPGLAPVRFRGGIYSLAWSPEPTQVIGPVAADVRYIGESGEFQRHMRQFGNSAGFFGRSASMATQRDGAARCGRRKTPGSPSSSLADRSCRTWQRGCGTGWRRWPWRSTGCFSVGCRTSMTPRASWRRSEFNNPPQLTSHAIAILGVPSSPARVGQLV